VANTLTGLIPTIYEALDVVSREMVGAVMAVNRDSQVARAAKGQQVTSFVTPAVTVSDVVPAVTPPNDGDQNLTGVQLVIDNVKRVPIRWNGEEARGLNTGGPGVNRILRDQWAQGMRALVNAADADVVAKAIKAASRAAGTPGTTPFSTSGDLSDFADAATILDDNGAPITDRQMILGSAAINRLRGKQGLLLRVNEAGTSETLRDGVITRLEGFDLHNSAAVKPIVKGTGAGYTLGANAAVGATLLTLASGTGTVNAGDVITLAGDPNAYVVNGVGIAAPGTITIGSPGLRLAHTSGDAVTVGGSYTPNIALSRSAMVLATRAPALPVDPSGRPMDMAEDRQTVIDPVSGIAFEVSMYLQYRQIQYEIALAWGAAVTKADNVAILRG
jgi:hypothetical protein